MPSKKNEMVQLEDLRVMHQKVMDFTFNCDNKASFLGAVIGVLITAIASATPFWEIIKKLKQSGIVYFEGGESVVFDRLSFSCGLCLSIGVIAILVALFAIFFVLKARLKTTHANSLIFFGSIANTKEEDYKTSIEGYDENKQKEDYIRQIHICSQICTKKFKAYNVAVVSSIVSLIAFSLFVIISIFL